MTLRKKKIQSEIIGCQCAAGGVMKDKHIIQAPSQAQSVIILYSYREGVVFEVAALPPGLEAGRVN